MPDPVRRVVVSKNKKTRKGASDSNWKPSAESCICNMHYKDFKGPTSRSNATLYPEYFKHPHGLWSVVPPPKRRLLQHHTPSDDGQDSVSGDDDSQILLSQDDPRDSPDSDDDLDSLKLEAQVRHLQATLQRLDSSLLLSAQIHMYTGLSKVEFEISVATGSWQTFSFIAFSKASNRINDDATQPLAR